MKKSIGKKHFLFFVPVLLVVFFDQLTKILIKSNFSLGESKLASSFFSLTYIQNTGAGFGLLKGFNLILIFIENFCKSRELFLNQFWPLLF